jgi:hypothetical protein
MLMTAEFIGWALGGLEREIAETRHRLGALTAQAAALRKRTGARVAAAAVSPTGRPRRRRRMSVEGRKRISEMMKKRWAERRKGK